MRVARLPGVFRPISDSWLLADAVRRHAASGERALDLCTGSGLLAVTAARAGAHATAVDISRRAVLSARLNARLNGVRVRALRGDLFAPLSGERFDLIASNPPYVPGEREELPSRGRRRAWAAGLDGRVLLDRICAQARAHLRPGGCVLLVHSSLIGEEKTLAALRSAGLEACVLARRRGPLGPLMSARAGELERRGLLAPGRREEEVLVIRGRAPARVTPPAVAPAPARPAAP